MKLKYFLIFVISNFLIQLNAQLPSPPPCEGTICQGVCVDLMVMASGLPAGACAGEFYGGFQFQLDITGVGADLGNYNILTFNNSGFNNGFFVHNPGDPTTLFPTIIPIVDGCEAVNQTYTYEIRCPDDDSLLASGIIGTVTVYPQPFLFGVNNTPQLACNEPFIFPPDCGELIIEEIPPINDCDNLTTGVLNYEVDPGFDLTNAPACFTDVLTGEIITPFCEEDCPCDAIFCNGICTDLMVTTSQLPVTQCANGGEPITINITGQGAAVANYTVNIFDNNGNVVGNYFHLTGNPTVFDISPVFSDTFCEPTTFQLTYLVGCFDVAGTVIASGVLGDITAYPNANLFLPEIIEGQPCGVGPTILPATCGTVITNPDPIPNAQCGEDAQDQVVMWSADFGFDTNGAPDCFFEDEIMGEFTIFACPDDPGAPCSLACFGEGVLDENCTCVAEDAPQVVIESVPAAGCQNEPINVIVDFTGTIQPGSNYQLEITDQNGNLVNSYFVNLPSSFQADLSNSFNYEPCFIREATYTFTLKCNIDNSIIGTPITVGPITIYPIPSVYFPYDVPGVPCESEPQVFVNDYCEATVNIVETVPPVNDCDAPQDGYVSWEVVPTFETTNAPACFTSWLTGQYPIPPCLSDCTCDGIVCQDVCVDLMVTISNLPAYICTEVQYQMEVTGLGADIGHYIIRTYDNNGILVGSAVHNPGQSTTLFPYISNTSSFLGSCEPLDQTYTYEIECQGEGTILASGTVGTATIYPEIEDFFPGITPSIACEQDLRINLPTCGTLIVDPDPIPVPGCGGEDTQVNWSVDFGFEYPPDCNISPIEGTETVFACGGTPGDPCDDNNYCTENDTLDENCSCNGEGPTATLATTLPEAICLSEPLILPVTVDYIPYDGMLVGIINNDGIIIGLEPLVATGPLTINISVVFSFPILPCSPQEFELFIRLICPFINEPIGASVPIGTIIIYPNIDTFMPTIEPAILCGEEPVISPPLCGDLALNVSPQSPIACPAGNNGFVDWAIDPGFDISVAPDCFDTVVLSGQELITACSNCCPLVVEVSIADPGPFCSGDMTEVCATFDAAFETDGQITINGVDALAGEDQICFQLDLVNEGCNYQPVQLPFEIICNEDGSVSNEIIPDILIAPDPANFQYQVFTGGCGFPPFISPLNGSPCAIFSNSSSIIITQPINGCPPIPGEVEIPLDYFDENFNLLDVTTFGCPAFETSLILPQPGCSTCPCPNTPANITLTENACEGGPLEICLEFEEGDEANAIGTQVQITRNTGNVAFYIVAGDGMSTVYCSEFYPNTFIDCAPVTEDFSVALYCHDGTPIIGGNVATTVYPSLDKFSYDVVPAVDNCPLEFVPPDITVTGDCDLDIQTAITTAPVNGCPPVQGEITYSVNYSDPTPFANAPTACLFTPIVDAVEPIPACDTCDGACEDEIMGTVFAPAGCDVNGIEVTIYDDMGNIVVVLTTDMNGVYDSSPTAYPCGIYSVELTNNLPQCYLDASGTTGPKTFVIDGDDNNTDTDGQDFMPISIPTLSQWGLIILCLLLMCFGSIKMSSITLVNNTH